MGTHLNHQRLLALQKQIYGSLQTEVRTLFGKTPPAIAHYQTRYHRDFKPVLNASTLPTASWTQLIRDIRKSRICLVGDFHTFAQAQRGALRILRELVPRPQTRTQLHRWALGLEMISSDHQAHVDAYQRGELSTEAFHKKIRYTESWGFPWEHYEPLFMWAKKHRVRLIALNRPHALRPFWSTPHPSLRGARRELHDLLERDRWAAGILLDATRDSGLHILVLYGEHHLADAHLPKEISNLNKHQRGQRLSLVVVHQNHDALYWKLAARGPHTRAASHRATVVALRPGHFCVLESPPWAKLQSLVDWGDGDQWTDSDSDSDSLGGPDPLTLMKKSLAVIMGFAGQAEADLSSLTVHSVTDANAARLPGRKRGLRLSHPKHSLSQLEQRLMNWCISENVTYYHPASQTAWLGTPTPNRCAELAALHLLRLRTGSHPLIDASESGFAQAIIDASFGFLASLWINPNRKADLLADHLRKRRADRLRAQSKPIERAARDGAIRALKKLYLAARSTTLVQAPAVCPSKTTRIHPAVLYLAARYIGRALAKELHHRLVSDTRGNAGHARHALRAIYFQRLGALRDPRQSLLELIRFSARG